MIFFFFFQAEDGIRDGRVTGVQTCALPIWCRIRPPVAIPLDEMMITGPRTALIAFDSSSVRDRKSTRLNSSHPSISYAVFCLKKKKKKHQPTNSQNTQKPSYNTRHVRLVLH